MFAGEPTSGLVSVRIMGWSWPDQWFCKQSSRHCVAEVWVGCQCAEHAWAWMCDLNPSLFTFQTCTSAGQRGGVEHCGRTAQG